MFSLHERPLTFCYQPAPGTQKLRISAAEVSTATSEAAIPQLS